MKVTWRLIVVAFLVFLVVAPAFNFPKKANASNPVSNGNFYVGVTYGSDSVAEAKSLIDNVSGYTNLFVVDSATISGASNGTALDEICNYAVKANMSVIVYFYMIYYNVTANISSIYNSSTWDAYGLAPWHVSWLNSTKERWGDKFLGVYLFDEPGGKQIDTGYWGGTNTTFSGSRVRTFDNVSNYDDAANRYISSIRSNRGMQILSNTSFPNGLNYTIPAFTSDYALYWFDYKAGYSAVFAELGGNRGLDNKTQQIALCRGAAQAQNKDWGAIITWTTDNPPTPETGANMLQDMTLAYDAGAKYVIAFNYAVNGTGGLADEQFSAIKQFWTNIQSSPGSPKGQITDKMAFVLPTNYGWGMRTVDDKIWGLWSADNLSLHIWQNMNTLLGYYGSRLDIIYDDPQFNVTGSYGQIYLWNSTILTLIVTPIPTPSSTPNSTSTPATNVTVTTSPGTTSAVPTSTPPTSGASSPPRNSLPLLAEVIVPIGAIAFVALYLRQRFKKPLRSVFPTVPVSANLKGFGKGTLQLTGETLKFSPRQVRFGKPADTNKQIELVRVENLNAKGNQISVQTDGRTNVFSVDKKLTSPVFVGIKAAWDEQKKILEKAAAAPEQKQLKVTFSTVACYVDPLFDIFSYLHGEIDWKNIESCLKRCENSIVAAPGSELSAVKMDLANLSVVVKQRQPDLVAKETRLVLQSTFDHVLGLHSENQFFEQFHPNYGDLKTAVTAYYALNDILLGESVGDAEVANEKIKLVTLLSHLLSAGNQNPFAAETLTRLANAESAAISTKTRSLFANQLSETLNHTLA